MDQSNLPAVQHAVYYPIETLERMAQAVAKSQLFGMKSPEQALALMLIAQAEGQHPATITQDYDIIQGRPARKTNSVLARFQSAGGVVQWHELTDRKVRATFSHRSGGSLDIEWTIEQAQKAGLTNKDNWKHYPRAMLRSRCIAEGIRAVFPAAIGGALVAEEAMDMPAAQPLGPTGESEEDMERKWIALAKATTTAEGLEAVWKDGVKELQGAKAKVAYDHFKAAVSAHGALLKNPPIDVTPEPGSEG